MTGEYPLIEILREAHRNAVESALANGRPLIKYADIIEHATGGKPETYEALCRELVQQEFDELRMALSWPPYLQARKRFVDALGEWINRTSMEMASVFEIAELIGGPAFDVERTTYGEAWSLIRGDDSTT